MGLKDEGFEGLGYYAVTAKLEDVFVIIRLAGPPSDGSAPGKFKTD